MKNGCFNISDKYAGNGLHYVSRMSKNGEIKNQLFCICNVCGKDYPIKKYNRKQSAVCPECRKELRKMSDNGIDNQADFGGTVEFK